MLTHSERELAIIQPAIGLGIESKEDHVHDLSEITEEVHPLTVLKNKLNSLMKLYIKE